MTTLQYMLDAPSHRYSQEAWRTLAAELAKRLAELETDRERCVACGCDCDTCTATSAEWDAAEAARDARERERMSSCAMRHRRTVRRLKSALIAACEKRDELAGDGDEMRICVYHGDDKWHDGAGWYYHEEELACDGTVGAFKTRGDAISHAETSGLPVVIIGGTFAVRRDKERAAPAPDCTSAPPACPEPASPLPWEDNDDVIFSVPIAEDFHSLVMCYATGGGHPGEDPSTVVVCADPKTRGYIVHACNAHPKLVTDLKRHRDRIDKQTRRLIGERNMFRQAADDGATMVDKKQAYIDELKAERDKLRERVTELGASNLALVRSERAWRLEAEGFEAQADNAESVRRKYEADLESGALVYAHDHRLTAPAVVLCVEVDDVETLRTGARDIHCCGVNDPVPVAVQRALARAHVEPLGTVVGLMRTTRLFRLIGSGTLAERALMCNALDAMSPELHDLADKGGS